MPAVHLSTRPRDEVNRHKVSTKLAKVYHIVSNDVIGDRERDRGEEREREGREREREREYNNFYAILGAWPPITSRFTS